MGSRQAATGFTGRGTIKAEALDEAQQFCSSKIKDVQVVSTSDSQPPYVLGNFPRTEVHFMCLSSGDPERARPKLEPRPDIVIENRSPQAVALSPAAAKGDLSPVSIESQPTEADVYIDGAFVGSTPLVEYRLSPGDYEIEISNTDFEKWSRKLRAGSGVPIRVSATLSAFRLLTN